MPTEVLKITIFVWDELKISAWCASEEPSARKKMKASDLISFKNE